MKQNIIALVYDFDETLSPKAMQEYTILDEIGITGKEFWESSSKEARKNKADSMLTYMRLIIEKATEKKIPLTKKLLTSLGKKVEYFKGVENYWFDAIDAYVKEKSAGQVKVEHYVISAGNREILEGVSIFKKFTEVYASEYFFDFRKQATFVNRVITDTTKTQYIYRINKGVLDTSKSVNDHMPKAKRRIPFENIIYYGDGDSDVPCMALTKGSGGSSVAVYKPNSAKKIEKCKQLLKADRIDFYAPADYRAGKKLEEKTRLILDKMIAGIVYKNKVVS